MFLYLIAPKLRQEIGGRMATYTKRTKQDGKTTIKVEIRVKGYPSERATFDRLTDAKAWAIPLEQEMKRGRHLKDNEAKKDPVVKKYFTSW